MRFALLITTTLIAIRFVGGATAAEDPVLTAHAPWKKVCFKSQKTGPKAVCDTRAEVRKRDDGSLLVSVGIIEREGEAAKLLRVIVPLGMQLRHGTRLIVKGADIKQSPYATCTAVGCMSDYEATPELLGSMRVGQGLLVQAVDQNGKPRSVTLSLADFSGAYDGPQPKPIVDEIYQRRRPWLDDTLKPALRPRER